MLSKVPTGFRLLLLRFWKNVSGSTPPPSPSGSATKETAVIGGGVSLELDLVVL